VRSTGNEKSFTNVNFKTIDLNVFQNEGNPCFQSYDTVLIGGKCPRTDFRLGVLAWETLAPGGFEGADPCEGTLFMSYVVTSTFRHFLIPQKEK
jgi:hypothetical protein